MGSTQPRQGGCGILRLCVVLMIFLSFLSFKQVEAELYSLAYHCNETHTGPLLDGLELFFAARGGSCQLDFRSLGSLILDCEGRSLTFWQNSADCGQTALDDRAVMKTHYELGKCYTRQQDPVTSLMFQFECGQLPMDAVEFSLYPEALNCESPESKIIKAYSFVNKCCFFSLLVLIPENKLEQRRYKQLECQGDYLSEVRDLDTCLDLGSENMFAPKNVFGPHHMSLMLRALRAPVHLGEYRNSLRQFSMLGVLGALV